MMQRNGSGSVKVVGLVGAGVLIIGGAVWGLARSTDEADKNPLNLPESLLVDSLKAQAEQNPGKMMETMRKLRDESLTDEQRRAARRNVGRVWRERLDKSVEEYFAASDDQKNVVLDRQIDQMQEMRKRMEEQRKQWMREREAQSDKSEDPKEAEARRQQWRRRHVGATRGQRKARSESRSPDQSARRSAYFAAVRKRAQERGIDMPGYGGHGGGGNRGRRP